MNWRKLIIGAGWVRHEACNLPIIVFLSLTAFTTTLRENGVVSVPIALLISIGGILLLISAGVGLASHHLKSFGIDPDSIVQELLHSRWYSLRTFATKIAVASEPMISDETWRLVFEDQFVDPKGVDLPFPQLARRKGLSRDTIFQFVDDSKFDLPLSLPPQDISHLRVAAKGREFTWREYRLFAGFWSIYALVIIGLFAASIGKIHPIFTSVVEGYWIYLIVALPLLLSQFYQIGSIPIEESWRATRFQNAWWWLWSPHEAITRGIRSATREELARLPDEAWVNMLASWQYEDAALTAAWRLGDERLIALIENNVDPEHRRSLIAQQIRDLNTAHRTPSQNAIAGG